MRPQFSHCHGQAPRNTVVLWQVISIIFWGTVFDIFATLGVNLLAGG
ncbi:MAG: hypothetical protein ACK4UY_09590 [Dietzia sp.]